MSDSDGYYGTQRPEENGDQYNAIAFVVRSILNGRNFAALVKVVNVTADGGVSLAGTVDVQPLVNQLDGQGKAVPHGVVNDLPYLRAQGGANAIILDPQPGDIGIAIFCDRDGSSVQASRDVANPGSLRRSDMADGVYMCGLLNSAPEQYVMFTDDGISIVSPGTITMQAQTITLTAPTIEMDASTSITANTPTFTINGNLHATGASTLDGTVTAGADVHASGTVTGDADVVVGGKSLKTHKHGLVKAGTDQSGTPL